MCEPATIAMIAISTVSTMMTYEQQSQASRYSQALAIKQGEAANQSYINQTKQMSQQEVQQNAGISQQMQQESLVAAQARSTAIVAAGEAGVSGVSVDALLGDFYRQESHNVDAIRHNQNMQGLQNGSVRESLQAQAQSRINSAASSVSPAPSGAAAALKIAGHVVNYGAMYSGWGTK